jgi:hypothetical protein
VMKIKGIDIEVGDIVYIRAEGYRYGERAQVIQIGSTSDSTHFFEGLNPGAVRRFALRGDEIATIEDRNWETSWGGVTAKS